MVEQMGKNSVVGRVALTAETKAETTVALMDWELE